MQVRRRREMKRMLEVGLCGGGRVGEEVLNERRAVDGDCGSSS